MNDRELRASLRDFGDIEVCSRCLVILNATCQVIAKHPSGRLEICDFPTDMLRLKAWVIARILEPGWWFEIGSTTDRFKRFATWYGDTVCAYHLYRLGQREAREYP